MEKQQYILIIGASEYTDPHFAALDGVRYDAVRLKEVLGESPDGVVQALVCHCGARPTKKLILQELHAIAAQAAPAAQVLIYLGGHGTMRTVGRPRRTMHYFVPTDARHDDIEASAISTMELVEALGRIKAGEVAVILDFCYSGGMLNRRFVDAIVGGNLGAGRSICVAAAARGNENVPEDDTGTVFMEELRSALAGRMIVPDVHNRISMLKALGHAIDAVAAGPGPQDEEPSVVLHTEGPPIHVTRANRTTAAGRHRLAMVYPRGHTPALTRDLVELIGAAREISLLGTALQLLRDKDIVEALRKRAKTGEARIRICLANPYSRAVQNRLIEEEMFGQLPPLGMRGLEEYIKALPNVLQELRATGAGGIEFSLFENYPTMATFIFDNIVLYYVYPYHLLGADSPLKRVVRDGGHDVEFLVDNARRVMEKAVPAETVLKVKQDSTYVDPDWMAAAVFLMPQPGRALYRFGSQLLGYDLLSGEAAAEASPVPAATPFRGEAGQYGFHLTLADSLLFATEAALERAEAELTFLAREFTQFDLRWQKPVNGYQKNPGLIVLPCEDPTGKAEALHHEMVARIYPLAISSHYRARLTSRRAKRSGDPRTNFMVERYLAPHILSRFHPHFTLLSGADADHAEPLTADLRTALEARVRRPSIRMTTLCLVVKDRKAGRWRVKRSWHLERPRK